MKNGEERESEYKGREQRRTEGNNSLMLTFHAVCAVYTVVQHIYSDSRHLTALTYASEPIRTEDNKQERTQKSLSPTRIHAMAHNSSVKTAHKNTSAYTLQHRVVLISSVSAVLRTMSPLEWLTTGRERGAETAETRNS